ncbi:MAG: hypothetical protein NTV43_15870 [Methylococcales bacterium]|nr:hypothetical protein [Methylococcales bacterium]
MKRYLGFFLLLVLFLGQTAYAHEISMPKNAPRPLKIGVAVFVNNISKVNDQTDNFEASVDIQLRWKDNDLAFNTHKQGSNRLEFKYDAVEQKLASIWSPALTLANANIQSKAQGLFIYADGTVVLIQRVKAVFDAPYRLDAFPFDTQNLPIHLLSERYNTHQIALIQEQADLDNSGLRKGLSLLSWEPQRLKFVASSTRGWNGQFYPEMQAQIVLSRMPTAYLLATLMPFFLVMLIPTIATFFINLDTDKRLGYLSSSILALVALSFTYSSRYAMLPPGNITTQLVVIGSGYQIVMILLSVTIFNQINAKRWFTNTFIIPEIASYLRWAVPLAMLGLVLTRVLLIALIV